MTESWANYLRQAMHWLGRFERTTLVSLLLLAAGLWAFAELVDEVFEGDTQSVDRSLVLALRNPDDLSNPLGPLWFEETVRDFTALGGVGVLTFMTLATTGFLLLQGKTRATAFVLVAIAGAVVASLLLKRAFDRPRPNLVPHGSHVYTTSFPSGHSMLAASTYLTLGALLARVQRRRILKAYFLVLAIALTLAVGCSRVYLGVHWPTDVLAGWTLGACWALMCWTIALRLQREGAVEGELRE